MSVSTKKLLSIFIGIVLMNACSLDSPTSPGTKLDNPTFALTSHDPSALVTLEQAMSFLDDASESLRRSHQPLAEDEDFDCSNIEEVRVRFSEPGFIDALTVGLWAKFIGMPAGHKTLRIWWDRENEPRRYEDIDVGDGGVNPLDETVFDFESVIEHTYEGIRGAEARRVRVEMLIEGQTGNCARNRDIVVSPDSVDHLVSFAGLSPDGCRGFSNFAAVTVLADVVPPIPAGMTYTLRARVEAPAPGQVALVRFQDASATDVVEPPRQFSSPPYSFTANLDTTVSHSRIAVTAIYLNTSPPATPLSLRLTELGIPGRTVGFAGAVSTTCP